LKESDAVVPAPPTTVAWLDQIEGALPPVFLWLFEQKSKAGSHIPIFFNLGIAYRMICLFPQSRKSKAQTQRILTSSHLEVPDPLSTPLGTPEAVVVAWLD